MRTAATILPVVFYIGVDLQGPKVHLFGAAALTGNLCLRHRHVDTPSIGIPEAAEF